MKITINCLYLILKLQSKQCKVPAGSGYIGILNMS